MYKTQLINAVAERLGDRRAAEAAVNAVFETIADKVAAGESVQLTGFGTFSRASRPARDYYNPATGGRGSVPATNVPRFKAGADFKGLVASKQAAAS